MATDPKFVRFLVLFNRDRDYYECHDVMEELWLEEGRSRFWQGLLQVAVGLHHYENDNYTGAVKLLRAALEKLDGYADAEAGIDVKRLREDAAAVLAPLEAWLAEGSGGHPPEPEPIEIRVTDPQLAGLVAAETARPHGDQPRADGE
ncbi:MAG: DUF309 domain-containing protein [Paenibacillaceae bacterium]|nr:MAG: DUF309 domain-containing protein [Paenibacillaceae bacterium]